jgi:chorismate--pyruvate lyase
MLMKAPLPYSPGWCVTLPPSLSCQQKYWLFRPGALTAGLRQLGTVRLRVLAEYVEGISTDEALAVGVGQRTPAWVREVVISVNGLNCIVARSLTLLPASHGAWQSMRRLMGRPLADILYQDRNVQRSAFVCRRLRRSLPLYHVASAYCVQPNALWARRSVFWRHRQPLLVAECFLPTFWRISQPLQ